MDALEIRELVWAAQTMPKYTTPKHGLYLPPLLPPSFLLSRDTQWSGIHAIELLLPVHQLVVMREISTTVICGLHGSCCKISQSDSVWPCLSFQPLAGFTSINFTMAPSYKHVNILWLDTDTNTNISIISIMTNKTFGQTYFLSHHWGTILIVKPQWNKTCAMDHIATCIVKGHACSVKPTNNCHHLCNSTQLYGAF